MNILYILFSVNLTVAEPMLSTQTFDTHDACVERAMSWQLITRGNQIVSCVPVDASLVVGEHKDLTNWERTLNLADRARIREEAAENEARIKRVVEEVEAMKRQGE